MNTPSNDDEEEIFFRAAALPPLERAAFVAIHCENTPLVRARIERLLAVHDDDAFMATPAAEALAAFSEHDASDERPGERIANYRLIEPLGSGGFGTVWRAEQERLTDATLVMQGGQMIGTPLYMSPEQAVVNGIDVDTRSDIWSLGVLLYEMLTGQPPFESGELGHDELRRAIRERDPRKPSSALTTLKLDRRTAVAVARRCEPAKLQRTLRGDLDRIAMKALEKEREQRYQTANGFAMDVRRYLDREPIVARPPGAFYRLRRLVQRNTIVFGLGTAIFVAVVAVVAGLIASLAQAKRAGRALADLQKTAPVFASQARALAAAEHFDEAIARIGYAAQLRPDVAEYPVTKGDLLQVQLRLREAAESYREALRIDPAHARAQANFALSKRLLAAQGSSPRLSHAGLTELFEAMQQERRPAAELLTMSRLLGEEDRIATGVLGERLAGLPVTPERPLTARIKRRPDGLLSLDLSGTGISNLSALEGLPLAALDLSGCAGVRDLRSLRALPLRELKLSGIGTTDLSPLADLPLDSLDLSHTKVSDLSPLQGSLLGRTIQKLWLERTKITDFSPLASCANLRHIDLTYCTFDDPELLRGKPLAVVQFYGTKVTKIDALAGMPIEEIYLYDTAVTDFSPLLKCPKLWRIQLPRGAKNVEVLREFRQVTHLGYERFKPAADFWREFDAGQR